MSSPMPPPESVPGNRHINYCWIELKNVVIKVEEMNELLDEQKDIKQTIERLKTSSEENQRYIEKEEKSLKKLHREMRQDKKELKALLENEIGEMERMQRELDVE